MISLFNLMNCVTMASSFVIFSLSLQLLDVSIIQHSACFHEYATTWLFASASAKPLKQSENHRIQPEAQFNQEQAANSVLLAFIPLRHSKRIKS